jgi:vitamin-K-epoxide reductase (warfarin-sensitive)
MACYSASIFIASLLALSLSAYSVYIEKRISEDDEYDALCDISPDISCTKVYSSEYAKGFGLDFLPEELKLSNGSYGIVFYLIFALLSKFYAESFFNFLILHFFQGFTKNLALVKVQLILSVTSIVVSIYLAYIMYFILANLCIVCVATYVLNTINFILVLKKLILLRKEKINKQD